MGWIAISDGRHAWRRPPANDGGMLLPVGSLVVEASLHGATDRPRRLVSLDRMTGWRHRLRVTLSPDGEVTVEHRQGESSSCAALYKPRVMANDTLRITYAWDAPRRMGWLAAENLTAGGVTRADFDDPPPLPVEDIAALTCDRAEGVAIDGAVSLLAVSDRIEPVGPMPGLAAGTRVDTATGPRPVDSLAPGDLVRTAFAGLQPVRHVVSREVPALGQFAPVRLRAPFLGLRSDLSVAPHHRLMIDGSDIEYLFGTESALVEARYLGPMSGRADRPHRATVTYVQVVLDSHDCLNAQGAWGESLFIGDIARRPERLKRSVLSGVPAARLPVHGEIAGPLLKPYEAMVLVSNLCA